MIASSLTPVARQMWSLFYALAVAATVAIPLAAVVYACMRTAVSFGLIDWALDYFQWLNVVEAVFLIITALAGLIRLATTDASPGHASPS